MGNNNYVSVGNIIEQERLKRQAQIAKGVSSDVYDHIEKAHQDDLSKGVEMTDNLSRFADDVDNLNKAETELLLSKLQRQIVADPESSILKSFRSIAIDHLNDIEKAYNVGDERQYQGQTYYVHAFNAKGQPLWRKKKDGGVSDKKAGASAASTDALKRAAADKNAEPEVREAAKKELDKRGGDSNSEKSSDNSVSNNKSKHAKVEGTATYKI